MEEQTIRLIRELSPKPSDAIKAMLDGLRKLPDDNFRVDMFTFGIERDGICYGCAATCAVFYLAGRKPTAEHIDGSQSHAKYLGLVPDDLAEFENAIDDFRRGFPKHLLRFYSLAENDPRRELRELFYDQDWYMDNGDWEEEIPQIEAYRDKLLSLGY